MTIESTQPIASDGDGAVITRDARGRIGRGNQLALKSGAWSKTRTLPAHILTWRSSLIADQGGDVDLQGHTLRASYIRRIAVVEFQLQRIEDRLAGTTSDRMADRTFDRYMALLKQWDTLAQRLGMERRSRAVASPLDYIAGKVDA